MEIDGYLKRTYWFVRQKDGKLAVCLSEEEAKELSREIHGTGEVMGIGCANNIKEAAVKIDEGMRLRLKDIAGIMACQDAMDAALLGKRNNKEGGE